MAWGITGAALTCFESCLQHGQLTMQQGYVLAETEAFQNDIVEMAGEIVKSQLLSLHCGRNADMQQLTPLQVVDTEHFGRNLQM